MFNLSILKCISVFFLSKSVVAMQAKKHTSKHLELLLIHAPKTHVKSHGRDEQDARQTYIQDDEMGILCERGESHSEQGADAGHGNRERVHNRAHTLGRLVVGMFGARGKAEHLGHAADRVDRHLQKHGNVIRDASIVRGLACERRIVARRAIVDELLQARRVGHGDRQEEEAKGDAGGGAEGDTFASEPGVDAFLHEGVEDDARDRVDGFDGVVGDARVDHLAGLGDEVVEGLVQAEPVEGEEKAGEVGGQDCSCRFSRGWEGEEGSLQDSTSKEC